MSTRKCRVQNAECRVKENFLTLFGNYLIKILFELCEKSYINSSLCTLNSELNKSAYQVSKLRPRKRR